MPRVSRIVAVGYPHHITQRGNYKQNVFIDDNDRRKYLFLIQKYSEKYGLSILSYCLMQNHVHFIAIPSNEDSLAKTFNVAHLCYSQYFNDMLQSNGHLWQGRFNSYILDDAHLVAAAKYVERNPVRAKLVEKPWDWIWSSASAHIDKDKAMIPLGDLFKYVEISPDAWKGFIEAGDEDSVVTQIDNSVVTGKPLGSETFVKKLEKKLGRHLMPAPRGRPWRKE